MQWRMALALAVVVTLSPSAVSANEEEVRAFVAHWYETLRETRKGGIWFALASNGTIDPSPCHCEPQPRNAQPFARRYSHLLAVQAEKFAYEITSMRVEQTLARVDVWERGWTYAPVAKRTTQTAAGGLLILENKDGKGWKVLLYQSRRSAIRPEHVNEPMPDLSPAGPK